MIPMAIGFMPFGFVIGATVSESSIDDLAGWAGAFLIAAGSAQLAAVEMVDAGAAPLTIIATAMIINVRLAVYGAGLASWFAQESRASRRVVAYFVIDPTYLLSVARFEKDDPGPTGRRSYYLGAGVTLFSLWTLAQTIAMGAGGRIPEQVRLDAAAPLLMAGMLATSVNTSAARVATVIGGSIVVAGSGLPWSSATLIAIVVGSVAGSMKVGDER